MTRVTLTLFRSQDELMHEYGIVLSDEAIPAKSHGGRCEPSQASEGGYVPGDSHGFVVTERSACYRDTAGKAHYVATAPPYVLIRVDGMVRRIDAVEQWAWTGNRDQPGGPTVWRDRGS